MYVVTKYLKINVAFTKKIVCILYSFKMCCVLPCSLMKDGVVKYHNILCRFLYENC